MNIKTFNLIIIIIHIVITNLTGQTEQVKQQDLEINEKHVQFEGAGLKYDQIWISLRNFRIGKSVNSKIEYAIYINNVLPAIGPKEMDVGRKYPIIEFSISLRDLGIDSLYTKQDTVILSLIASDSQTPADDYFLKETFGFIINPKVKSARMRRDIPLKLSEIPTYLNFRNKYFFPVASLAFKDLFTVRELYSPGKAITEEMINKINSIDSTRSEIDIADRLFLIDKIREFDANKIGSARFNTIIDSKF